ncbi:MAG: alpha/beta fold hydrolase [Gemmatales bacterium]
MPLTVPSTGGPIPGKATRIMYRSTDTHGRPTAVTGTYFEPTQDWKGPGQRPLITVAPGTQGQGDQCAPSKLFGQILHYRFPIDLMLEYEIASVYTLLAQGIAVVMTDYHGLGTPAVHDYLNREAQGHAVLDALRAAITMTGHTGPTGIFGYSQGGAAAGSAAELQGTYAPELDVVGSYVGAPPADLRKTLATSPVVSGLVPGYVGGFALGLVAYVSNGMMADYPELREEFNKELNAYGKTWMRQLSHMCIIETVPNGMFRSERSMTKTGKSVAEVLNSNEKLKEAIDAQRLGSLKPAAPVFLVSGRNDDVIPYGQVRDLAKDWCGLGATVELEDTAWIPPFFPYTAAGHLLPMMPALLQASEWFKNRLAGKPAPSNCAHLP